MARKGTPSPFFSLPVRCQFFTFSLTPRIAFLAPLDISAASYAAVSVKWNKEVYNDVEIEADEKFDSFQAKLFSLTMVIE